MDIRSHNREAWDRQVEDGNPWTIPASPQEIAAAREGRWSVLLTPMRAVPQNWFPPLRGARILCLASGGGQQGPILAAAGADVTVLDNSPRQLEQDRKTAEREGLSLQAVEGDMRDLSCFPDAAFDLVFHPVSNSFIPDTEPVWREVYRVLRPGACLLSGFTNPIVYLFDEAAYGHGQLTVAHVLPFSKADSLSAEDLARYKAAGEPLEFSHTLEELIGGQVAAGFVLIGFYEDRYPERHHDLLGRYTATFIATRACKSDSHGKRLDE
ncbi:MAG: class I SAM-dependent methyltransferase [Kiritimatiellae bacterium]|nr:class I SAM-dependent methyltransferase [Kiritimatiellia bacterium]